MSESITNVTEWVKEYELLRKTEPQKGDFLKTRDASLVRLEIILKPDEDPFIVARCTSVPRKVGDKLGWFCHGINDPLSRTGLKVILTHRAVDAVIRKFGLGNQFIGVQTLRVVRPSLKGTAIMAEVEEL